LALLDHPVARAAVDLPAPTVLAVALRKDNVLLGQIVNARREVRPFSDKEIAAQLRRRRSSQSKTRGC
jgi:hypothetical protein